MNLSDRQSYWVSNRRLLRVLILEDIFSADVVKEIFSTLSIIIAESFFLTISKVSSIVIEVFFRDYYLRKRSYLAITIEVSYIIDEAKIYYLKEVSSKTCYSKEVSSDIIFLIIFLSYRIYIRSTIILTLYSSISFYRSIYTKYQILYWAL